ncbi:hypothetical protein EON65_22300 [archaeon]|nr:MAG: hypothetical protein EON65_22300 [archaeon]
MDEAMFNSQPSLQRKGGKKSASKNKKKKLQIKGSRPVTSISNSVKKDAGGDHSSLLWYLPLLNLLILSAGKVKEMISISEVPRRS